MFRMYLNRFLYSFELKGFGVTLRFWQLRSNTTGKSSHLSIYPYVWTPWGSPKQFVTECHHNSSIPYVPGNVLLSIRTKGFWCNTLSLEASPVHNRKSSQFLGHLRPHGGPQNHLFQNATIIVMFRMYHNRFLYPFELKVFGVTLRFWQLRSNTT